MAHVKNTNRGNSSHARRIAKHEIFVKTLNRKKNHEGCTNKNIRLNGKV
jgi:hypothetical protein